MHCISPNQSFQADTCILLGGAVVLDVTVFVDPTLLNLAQSHLFHVRHIGSIETLKKLSGVLFYTGQSDVENYMSFSSISPCPHPFGRVLELYWFRVPKQI